MGFHLAQINIAVAMYTYDDSRFSGIADNVVGDAWSPENEIILCAAIPLGHQWPPEYGLPR